MFSNILKHLFYWHQFTLWNYTFLRFLRFYRRCSIKHSWPHCVPSFYWCRRSLIGSLCFPQLLNCLHHCLLQLLFLPIYNSFVLPWFYFLENLFFYDSTPCSNINIDDIHIYSDCLHLSYGFPFQVWCIFPLKQFFASLQTRDNLSSYVHSNHRCGKNMNYSFDLFEAD